MLLVIETRLRWRHVDKCSRTVAQPAPGEPKLSFVTRLLISRKSFVAILAVGLVSIAVACGSDSPAPTATQSSGGQQPTATTIPATLEPTATATTAPATATPVPTNTPGGTPPPGRPPTPTPTPGSSVPTPAPTATPTPIPAPTSTPTQAPATATPDVQFTPGVLNTVELVAGKDNTLYQSSIGATSNGSGTGLFVGKTNNNSLRRALVWFDISSVVPAGATIESVELTLTMNRTATAVEPVMVHRVNADWGEGSSDAAANEGRGANAAAGDVTWLHTFSPDQMWQTEGGDFVSEASAQLNVAGNGSYTWISDSLTADVQAWIDNPESNFGWVLTGDEENSKTAKRFASREHASEDARPTLVITFTPAP